MTNGHKPEKPLSRDYREDYSSRHWILLGLFAFNLLTHFSRLDQPNAVVFDEVHFGSFTTAYCCTHETFFDIHPPHGKLIIAGAGYLLGYRGGQDFTQISQPLIEGNAFALRAVPAFIGSIIPLLIFALLLQFGGTQAGALLAALLVSLDSALLLQTRIIALDGILLASIFGSLSLFLLGIQTRNTLRKMLIFTLSGGLAGLAVGTKLTGLVALAIPFVLFMVNLVRNPQDFYSWLRDGSLFLFGALTFYLSGWIIHFMLLDRPWPDIWGPVSDSFVANLLEIHRKALSANFNLSAGHPDAFSPWLWPFSISPVYYWVSNDKQIYLIGNLLLWWGAILLFLWVCLQIFWRGLLQFLTIRRMVVPPMIWLPICGYLIAFLPLLTTNRPLFIYHYLTALLFSVMTVTLWLEHIGWIKDDTLKNQSIGYYFSIGCIASFFFLLLPIVYGLDGGAQAVNLLFTLFPSWR